MADAVFKGMESERLTDIQIDEDAVKKKLGKPRSDKAAGVDDMSPRVLKELQEEICYPVMAIMKASLETGHQCLMIGRRQRLRQFSRKAVKARLAITGQWA